MIKLNAIRLSFLLCGLIIISSCETEKKSDSINEDDSVEKLDLDINEPELEEVAVLRKCYTGVVRGQDVKMNLELEEKLVTGELIYSENDKVVRSGSVIGEFSKDTLLVTFKYKNIDEEIQAEELIFIEDKKEFKVVQGSAKTERRGSLIKILDPSNVTFNGPVFEKYDCEQE